MSRLSPSYGNDGGDNRSEAAETEGDDSEEIENILKEM